MSDRIGRERELPVGYQFGDAGRFFDEAAQVSLFRARYVTPAQESLELLDSYCGPMARAWWDEHDRRLLASWNQREGGMHS